MKDIESLILRLNLTDRTVTRETTGSYADLFVGGRAVGSKILYDELQPGIDPLGPGNVLVFNNGPLSGTAAPSSARVDVSA